MRDIEVVCPSCGAQPGQPCRSSVEGITAHDTRIFRAMFTDSGDYPDTGAAGLAD